VREEAAGHPALGALVWALKHLAGLLAPGLFADESAKAGDEHDARVIE